MEMQEQRVADQPAQSLQEALAAALAVPVDEEARDLRLAQQAQEQEAKKAEAKQRRASPLTGMVPPATGRPPGVRNKLINLRDAVLIAFDRVGGAEYLVKLAEGTQSDRAAFVSLMNKVLPTQINANVDGGIKLELSWVGQRSIGTTAAQIPEQRTQVLDLERDSEGGYRIIDQHTHVAGGVQAAAGGENDENGAGDARGA